MRWPRSSRVRRRAVLGCAPNRRSSLTGPWPSWTALCDAPDASPKHCCCASSMTSAALVRDRHSLSHSLSTSLSHSLPLSLTHSLSLSLSLALSRTLRLALFPHPPPHFSNFCGVSDHSVAWLSEDLTWLCCNY